jgi:hypothetical protein
MSASYMLLACLQLSAMTRAAVPLGLCCSSELGCCYVLVGGQEAGEAPSAAHDVTHLSGGLGSCCHSSTTLAGSLVYEFSRQAMLCVSSANNVLTLGFGVSYN